MLAFYVALYVLMIGFFYSQYGLIPCLTLPVGIVALCAAWFCFLSPETIILVFPLFVVAVLCFSIAFAFRRSAQRAREIRLERRQQAMEQHAEWLHRRNSMTVQEAWARREPFFGYPRSHVSRRIR